MPQSHNQKAFHSGEWSPNLYARVDLAKYHSGAALLENFFVDYRGGASNRPGTKYILQAYNSDEPVRLIPFSASFTVSYVLEFGDGYIRFYADGGVVLETAGAITGATQANPASITQVAHGYSTGDWIYITGVLGMTQLNGRYYSITVTGANAYTLADLNGVAVNSTGYTAYSSAGTGARVYTLQSPYAAADLALLKFAQNINDLLLCHRSYPVYKLTLISATNWAITQVTYGATIGATTISGVSSTSGAGSFDYEYVVTAIDYNFQEGPQSIAESELNIINLSTASDTNTISWSAVAGAQYYNVYACTKTQGTLPTDPFYGYIGSSYSLSFSDTAIVPDFSSTPPVAQQPFLGGNLASVTVTAAGTYTTVPSATVPAPSTGIRATVLPVTLSVVGTPSIAGGAGSTGFVVGDIIRSSSSTNQVGSSLRLVVATINGSGQILTVQPVTYPGSVAGAITSGATPSNNVTFRNINNSSMTKDFALTWGVTSIGIGNGGAGYTANQTVTFSSGAATATANLGTINQSYPSVPAFYQQRLALGATINNPQTIWFSIPGSYYNFNTSNPTQPDDAITVNIVSKELNEIKSMVAMPGGLVVLTSRQAWQINGGGAGSAITAVDIQAQSQAFNGCSDVPPILANYDILYVQAKGSIVRDLAYDFYKNIYTGTDISVLSSHLFFKHTIPEWAFAEEPFKVVWAVRDDGVLLSLTFLKEQELIGWAHSVTDGDFKSICSVTEETANGSVDAIYVVVERTINGNTVKYIERMAERFVDSEVAPNENCWFVDAGLQYDSTPATIFTGLEHLIGETVTGLADGAVIPPTVVPATGTVTLGATASVVTIGLPYTATLQTLILDMGEPTVIGLLKKLIAVTVRCADTLGIEFGRTLSTLVPLKDFSGTVDSQGVTLTNALVTTDAYQPIDPLFDTQGQYYIVQENPLPCTILGVVPEIKVEGRR